MDRHPVPLAQKVPVHRLGRERYSFDSGRPMGLLVLATKGTGKSTLLGRFLAVQDFLRRVPVVVLDPRGGTIDYFLDSLLRLPPEYHKAVFSRIRYVNMAGQEGRIVPLPIYAKTHPAEQPDVVSDRYVDVLKRFRPKLEEAQVQGSPRVFPLATAAGIILTSLDLGITEAPDLISHPRVWEPRLQEVLAQDPEHSGAVARIRQHAELALKNPRAFEERTELLLNQLSLFQFSPNFRAIFGATTSGIDWAEVVVKRHAVLLDFRDVRSADKKKFCLLWLFNSLMTYIKDRGHGHQHIPLSWIIDELSYLVGSAGMEGELLAGDLDELINQLMRSHGVWLTLASQELFQFSERIQKHLLSMGSVVVGRTSDPTAARILADQYYEYQPYKIKEQVPVWMSQSRPLQVAVPIIVDYTNKYFTMEEQLDRNSRIFRKLSKYHFMAGFSSGEGILATHLQEISIERMVRGQFVNEAVVAQARSLLMERDGILQRDVLEAIRRRLPQHQAVSISAHRPKQIAEKPPGAIVPVQPSASERQQALHREQATEGREGQVSSAAEPQDVMPQSPPRLQRKPPRPARTQDSGSDQPPG